MRRKCQRLRVEDAQPLVIGLGMGAGLRALVDAPHHGHSPVWSDGERVDVCRVRVFSKITRPAVQQRC